VRQPRRRAFTLVEVTAVIVLVALVAGAVTLRVRGTMRRATLAQTVDEWAGFDRLTRVLAESRRRPMSLVIDMGLGQVSRLDSDGVTEVGAALTLPEELTIAEVRLADGRRGWGRADVPYSSRGLSPSYAVCLEDNRGGRRWVLFAGLTGQRIEVDSDEALQAMFDVSARPNGGQDHGR